MVYEYSIKNIPLSLKFLIDFIDPVSLEPKYWFKPKDTNNILDNIKPEDIEIVFKEKKLIEIGIEGLYLVLMNGFLGKRFTKNERNDR